jgi:Arc/MetJ-type ribon-helix-helix transcriptional regulator
MKRTTIALPDDLAELVDSEARRQRTSVSDVIRRHLVRSLPGAAERPRVIAWAGLLEEPSMPSGERIDEAFAEGWADAIDRDRG